MSDEDCNRFSHYKSCSNTKSQKVTNMIESIALVETGLARIMNEEGEKLQNGITVATNINELISLIYSVKETLTNIIKVQMLLHFKLEEISKNILYK
jgi:hypothetical protein